MKRQSQINLIGFANSQFERDGISHAACTHVMVRTWRRAESHSNDHSLSKMEMCVIVKKYNWHCGHFFSSKSKNPTKMCLPTNETSQAVTFGWQNPAWPSELKKACNIRQKRVETRQPPKVGLYRSLQAWDMEGGELCTDYRLAICICHRSLNLYLHQRAEGVQMFHPIGWSNRQALWRLGKSCVVSTLANTG